MSQAAAEQFARSLRVLDGIYAEVSGDERYLVHSSTTQHDSWIISVTDLSEGLWEKEVFFEEMQHQKKMLGFGKESWKDFLSRLVEALQSDSLFVGLNDNEQMKFTAWCYCNGKQISYTYTLLPGETDEIKSKVADMVFDLLAFARRKRKSELEAHELLSQVEKHREDRTETTLTSSQPSSQSSSQTMPCTLSTSSGGATSFKRSSESTYEMAEPAAVANTVPNKAQAKGAKRKQGFSLVNPRVKRWYGEKGARIGSNQAPPNKLAPPAVDD
ncbi:uncharacterized protein ACA1_117310 [Acanthamoeba castellanii str. Neff]|uniref:Uncharacterized protein n=1 Tax=Acanthamoeba castellanii (strain ATCC 30010 / Neff) TaxID=1257118 RepID=L8H683_ACACF|nr:uncharacterized protein ACA1_117310 [Acanthamoeba castellanii str. Neff]ELR20258.1 hypothetical protein ACA1_117310 [Acanthamoeba castellanii str. Neff]